MAKGSPHGNRNARSAAAPDVICESNIAEVEKEALARVSRAISILDEALARWDALKDKQEDLQGQVKRYRRLLEAFCEWERKALLARGSGEDFKSRLDRLREFVAICQDYERGE